jgi:hypothetical protein
LFTEWSAAFFTAQVGPVPGLDPRVVRTLPDLSSGFQGAHRLVV